MPWMRDNNIKQPQTLNEFTEYLRYVKSHDLNKNGKSDEIAVAFDKDNVLNFVSYIAKAYMPFVNGEYYGLAMENGKIVEQYKDSRFRDALKYIAGIYKEGLILSDSLTMSNDQLKGLLENPEPIVGVGGQSWLNNYVAWPGTRFMEHYVLPALEGPTGQRNASNNQPWNIMGAKWFVTNKAKDPGLAIALYDYLINLDVELDGYVGPKGQAWTDADPGALCMLGDAARFKMLMAFGNTPVNISWGQANPMIRNIEWQLGEQATGVEVLQRWYETGDPAILKEATDAPIASGIGPWFITATQLSKYKMPDDLFIPLMALNDADNARVTDINAVLNSFKEQAISEFIIGARDINNNAAWNTYIAELDRLGSAELVRIRQKYIK
jgi:putative aldouronate transport system substrate-binding protein